MIAVWPYLDPRIVTQADPQNPGTPVPNQVEDDNDQLPELISGSSSGGQEADAAGDDHQTGHYFSEDVLTTRGEVSASAYPIRTQLADGRPSLIIDPGSVGNLWRQVGEVHCPSCRSQWQVPDLGDGRDR